MVKTVRLAEISSLITKGTTPTTLGFEFQETGINFLKIECFDENGAFLPGKVAHVSAECHEKLRRSQLQSGDLLFSIAGAIGRVAIVTDEMLPANTNQALAIIRINNPNVFIPYVKLILRSPVIEKQFERKKQGVAQLNLSLNDINELTIPLPDLKQQVEYVNLFEKIESVINHRKAELNAFDDLIKARFVEMFGAYNADCCNKTIGDYAQVLGGYAFKSDEFIQDAIPVIRISNINEGKIIPDRAVCFSEQFWSDNPKFRAVAGDILMAMSGATTGKAGILRSNESLLINQRVACIRAKEGISLPEFLYAVTQLPWMYDLIQEKSAGCAQPNISGKQIENMPIPEATYMQQKEFASFVSRVDKSKLAVQKALDEAQLLFDSLMQNFF